MRTDLLYNNNLLGSVSLNFSASFLLHAFYKPTQFAIYFSVLWTKPIWFLSFLKQYGIMAKDLIFIGHFTFSLARRTVDPWFPVGRVPILFFYFFLNPPKMWTNKNLKSVSTITNSHLLASLAPPLDPSMKADNSTSPQYCNHYHSLNLVLRTGRIQME